MNNDSALRTMQTEHIDELPIDERISALRPGESITAEMSQSAYHARPEISSGFVRSMLDAGEWTTHHKYVLRLSDDVDSDAMRLGRLFHSAAPDPQGVLSRVYRLPTALADDSFLASIRRKYLGKTKAGLSAGDALDMHVPAHREYVALHRAEATRLGQVWCDDEELELQREQVSSVVDNPQTSFLFGNPRAKYEQVGFYRDKETGLLLKGMADVLIDDLVVDFKTTRYHTKHDFLRSALQRGMRVDLQCAHYCRVFKRPRAAVVTVRNFRPCEAMYYEIPPVYMRAADIALSIALAKIKECMDMGTWHSDGWGQANFLEPEQYQ